MLGQLLSILRIISQRVKVAWYALMMKLSSTPLVLFLGGEGIADALVLLTFWLAVLAGIGLTNG
jgi:hypothetical protein